MTVTKVEVNAIQFDGNNLGEIAERFDLQTSQERRPDGKILVNNVPLVKGDYVIKNHKGILVVTEGFFNEQYVKQGVVYNADEVQVSKVKAVDKLTKAIKYTSRLPYSKERDYIIHNLVKSLEALHELK